MKKRISLLVLLGALTFNFAGAMKKDEFLCIPPELFLYNIFTFLSVEEVSELRFLNKYFDELVKLRYKSIKELVLNKHDLLTFSFEIFKGIEDVHIKSCKNVNLSSLRTNFVGNKRDIKKLVFKVGSCSGELFKPFADLRVIKFFQETESFVGILKILTNSEDED